MSGIYGMVRFDGSPVTAESLTPIVRAMADWGPDGHGQWSGASAGLGHLMLHITPESFYERLPATLRTAPHLVITADARIDNREELFEALGVPAPGRGHTPDSSLILLAYERWGPDCVTRLLGDFAFAIWNSRERRLFCARDPFGCKPLVYFSDGSLFVFASDVKGVLAAVKSPRLHEPLLAAYLQMKTYYAEKELTFFRGVLKIQPAHTLIVTAGGKQASRYWRPENSPEVRLAQPGDYAQRLRELFLESVSCRMRSAFPVGCHLSGGLDSSAVTIAASRNLRVQGQELGVFSWSPEPIADADHDSANEHLRIEAVTRQEELSCQYVPPTQTGMMEIFQRDCTVEPIEMLGLEINVQRASMKQGLRVILSGWGGDDAVSNNINNYTEMLQNHEWSGLRRAIALKAAGSSGLAKGRRALGVLRMAVEPRYPDSLYSLLAGRFYMVFRKPCIRKDFAGLHQEAVDALRGPTWRRLPGFRDSLCHRLQFGHLQRRLEHWSTSGAAHKLEYRYPMLDRRIVEFMVGVPGARQYAAGESRSLFREAVGGLLPPCIDWRRAKASPRGRSANRRTIVQSLTEYQDILSADIPTLAGSKFVDPVLIQKAIKSLNETSQPIDYTGVSEAFSCLAMREL